MSSTIRHYEQNALIDTSPGKLFAYVDDHARLASHMSSSSWRMAGSRMRTQTDADHGQKVGSHIRMGGKIMGMDLFLDEVVTQYEPPYLKVWETVGDLNLLVISHYQMGFKIEEENDKSRLTVFINYELPPSASTRWLGYLFAGIYVKWCVTQMLYDPQKHFNHQK